MRMMVCRGLFFVLAVLLSAGVARAEPVIRDVSVVVAAEGRETIRITANAPLTVTKRFVLSDPDRLVIDLKSVRAEGISLPADYSGTLINSLRFGRFNATTSRLVIEVTSPDVVAHAVSTKAGLTIDLVSGETAPISVPSKPVKQQAKPAASVSPAVAVEKAKPLIVIDAGHGGQDPGAIGRNDVREKDITLAVALALRDGLLRTGRYRVALTREDDTYIMLPERVEIARKLQGDFFISIHADSHPVASTRGLSVYTLSETASDAEAQALAERENKSDIIGGLDLNTADKDVASILIDLTQRETADKSEKLADALVASMHPRVTLLERPHRFAGFRVLKAPDIPSVLIELGFVSNPTDERFLQSREYRDRVVASIIKGIDRYRGTKRR